MTGRPFTTLSALLLSVAALGACDDQGPTAPEERAPGTFAATLSGDLTGTVAGEAVFDDVDRFPESDTDDIYFVVSLRESPVESAPETIVLVGKGTPTVGTSVLERPEAGDLADGEWYAVYLEDVGGDGDYERFVASATAGVQGTVTFDEVTSTSVVGSLSFSGDGFLGSGVVDVTAEFHAEPGTIEDVVSD